MEEDLMSLECIMTMEISSLTQLGQITLTLLEVQAILTSLYEKVKRGQCYVYRGIYCHILQNTSVSDIILAKTQGMLMYIFIN